MKELKEHGPEDIVVAIAGNKNDLGDIRWASFFHLSLFFLIFVVFIGDLVQKELYNIHGDKDQIAI